ncbi:DNA topology modulation protein [Ornithinibacillus californiensis]|uniref:DNA topology modulation protein n=1 Tax=Ornithinibacillus californiensis TaxID=161536 RepID=UPI00064DE5DF|nr:DNA topology modulation protein [Ornithinibacillus californiensis]
MKKITILGNPGAGKSTLAKQLGEKLHIPVYHMDSFYWKPNWQPSNEDEFLQNHDEILKLDSWIIDGNYGATLPKRLENADTIIFLNYSTLRCLYGITKRRIQYRNKTRPDMGKDCPERLNMDFILWTKNYNKDKAPKMYDRLSQLRGKEILIFKNRKQLKKWLGKSLAN